MISPRLMPPIGLALKPATVVSGAQVAFRGVRTQPAQRASNSNDVGCSLLAALAVVGTLCAFLGWGIRFFR